MWYRYSHSNVTRLDWAYDILPAGDIYILQPVHGEIWHFLNYVIKNSI